MSCDVRTYSRSASNPNSATASRDFATNGTSTSALGLVTSSRQHDLEAPKRQPLDGWRPCKLDDGWGAVLDGPDVAALAEDPRGTSISITDSRGGSWTATISCCVCRYGFGL